MALDQAVFSPEIFVFMWLLWEPILCASELSERQAR